MSSEIVIEVEGLSKCYQIYEKPRDRLKQFILPRLRRWLGMRSRKYHSEFWALKNASFAIRKGEVVGIVGRNGSGKSTLLQMICGTLNPTAGSVQTSGRIAALLELGSGFNPEFTGRENVYMNASVLGLADKEIDARFDEIVSFADIGKFIEQPVKTYSSGMMVRLAFAVQVCVNPEILVVDEALAVGDIGFQYKCYKRMEALRDQGATILMVTHSSGSVLEFADRCIVLDKGEILADTNDVLAAILAYEKGMLSASTDHFEKKAVTHPASIRRSLTLADLQRIRKNGTNSELNEKRFGSARAIIESVSVLKADADASIEHMLIKPGDELVFRFRVLAVESIPDIVLGISLSKVQVCDVWGDNNLFARQPIALTPGEHIVDYCVCLPISAGEYLVHAGLACFVGDEREELDQRRPVCRMNFFSAREQVGVVYAPVRVFCSKNTSARPDERLLVDGGALTK